jgi:hypothetical protein
MPLASTRRSLLALGLLSLTWLGCNAGSDREEPGPLLDLSDIGFGLDLGQPNDPDGTPPEGDGTCDLPCLFGSVCVDGACVFPCEPACAPSEECLFGICIQPTGATCDPPCDADQRCVGDAESDGVCVAADGCEPECDAGFVCQRSGACLAEAACDADDDCGSGQRCVGGACLDPLPPDAWAARGATGFASEILVPGVLLGACCFDFTGDGLPDNALAGFERFSSVLGSEPLEDLYAEMLDDGQVGIGFDLAPTTDGRADFGILDVSADLDGDGEPESDADDRATGDATLRVTRSGLGNFGPLSLFPNAAWDGEILRSGPSDVYLTLPPGALLSLSDQPQRLRVQLARIEGLLATDEGGLATLDDEPLAFGGAIAATEIVDGINEAIPDCVCVSDNAPNLVRIEESDDGLTLSCNPRVSLVLCAGAEGACGQLPVLCEALPDLSPFLPWDVDLDGDGRVDAASVGLEFVVTPATLAR